MGFVISARGMARDSMLSLLQEGGRMREGSEELEVDCRRKCEGRAKEMRN